MPDTDGRPIAVVAAMKEEIEPLRRRLRDARAASEEGLSWHRGRLHGVDVALAVTGAGRRNAGDGARRLVARLQPARILAIGLGGALCASLRAGDLLIASEVRDGNRIVDGPDPGWLARVRDFPSCATGCLITVDEMLDSPAAKARWRPAAGEPPAVADMESASWARVAAANHIPYLILRAVSDGVDESLPPFLAHCRDANGGIDRRRALWQALRHPRSWPRLIELRSRMQYCARRLADLAESAVARA